MGHEHRRGVLSALAAYLAWGFFPIYWKALGHLPADRVLAWRVLASALFMAPLLAGPARRAELAAACRNRRALAGVAAAALLISVNWLTYIWAVNAGHVLESSLGYFINPLLNVLLGTLLLRERLRPIQWLPLLMACAGVLHLTFAQGRVPWIALTLATTFGLYGLAKKTTTLGSLAGLGMETFLLAPLALVWLLLQGAGGSQPASTWLLMAAAGPVTAIPLLLFAAGARRIPLWLTGLLQYLAPSIQFLVGLLLYHEPLDGARLGGFVLVWGGLALFAGESLWRQHRPRQAGSA